MSHTEILINWISKSQTNTPKYCGSELSYSYMYKLNQIQTDQDTVYMLQSSIHHTLTQKFKGHKVRIEEAIKKNKTRMLEQDSAAVSAECVKYYIWSVQSCKVVHVFKTRHATSLLLANLFGLGCNTCKCPVLSNSNGAHRSRVRHTSVKKWIPLPIVYTGWRTVVQLNGLVELQL